MAAAGMARLSLRARVRVTGINLQVEVGPGAARMPQGMRCVKWSLTRAGALVGLRSSPALPAASRGRGTAGVPGSMGSDAMAPACTSRK